MINGIVVDSSIWIDYLNKKTNARLFAVNHLIDSDSVISVPIIVQEILQGTNSDERFEIIHELFTTFKPVKTDPFQSAVQAASIYRFLRKKGITIRKPNDCFIAAICITNNFSIFHNDKDFDNIAKYTSLKIYKPKL